ncbi:hypothetical protein KO02_16270 [Sphingobacterium sp. ML3W]|uniref:hypothetical protein n=1 Tax=Sphingobacterium sp. ML3W TaxID=1538644 RepID=UPI0004F60EC0|nr:hypothetical protein [Sphingobacterium sp. ML3W]AIM38066.1 hypothetical protein KO02_16270 [Sphingobacterium sp. ML3W]
MENQKTQQTENKKETSVNELIEMLKQLPKDAIVFGVVKSGKSSLVYAHGNPISISAELCSAQDKDEKVKGILQVAVDGFRLAEETGAINFIKRSKSSSDVN